MKRKKKTITRSKSIGITATVISAQSTYFDRSLINRSRVWKKHIHLTRLPKQPSLNVFLTSRSRSSRSCELKRFVFDVPSFFCSNGKWQPHTLSSRHVTITIRVCTARRPIETRRIIYSSSIILHSLYSHQRTYELWFLCGWRKTQTENVFWKRVSEKTYAILNKFWKPLVFLANETTPTKLTVEFFFFFLGSTFHCHFTQTNSNLLKVNLLFHFQSRLVVRTWVFSLHKFCLGNSWLVYA